MRASRRRPRTIGLGAWLVMQSGWGKATLVASGLVAIGGVVLSLASAGQNLSHLPSRAAFIVSWSAGTMVAVGGARGAVTRDWNDGVIALLRLRGVDARAYLTGRMGGLVLLVAGTVMGAVGVATVVAASLGAHLPDTLLDAARALAYALAFGATIAPVALATVGAQRPVAGYLSLLAVLALPELATPWTAYLLPQGWRELTSIPAALAALPAGLADPVRAGAGMARAVAALGAVTGLAIAVARARIPRVREGEAV